VLTSTPVTYDRCYIRNKIRLDCKFY